MKNRNEIIELENELNEIETTIDYVYSFIRFSKLFTSIKDLQKYLVKEHDICVDEYNIGLERLKLLKGEKQ